MYCLCFCSVEFVAKHTPKAQTEYLRREMAVGKKLSMLIDEYPVGLVSVHGSLIENLYVLPAEWGKGYGARLLKCALGQCDDVPTLWVLNTNQRAYDLYLHNGFQETGNRKELKLLQLMVLQLQKFQIHFQEFLMLFLFLLMGMHHL